MIVAEISANVIENALLAFFYIKYLGVRPRYEHVSNWLILILSYIMFLESIIENTITFYEGFVVFVPVSLCIIFAMIFLKGGIFRKTIAAVIVFALMMASSMIVLTIMAAVINEDVLYIVTDDGGFRLFNLFTTKILYYIMLKFVVSRRNKCEDLNAYQWLLVTANFVLTFIVGIFIIKLLIVSPSSWLSVAAVLGLLAINLITLAGAELMSRQHKKLVSSEILRCQVKAQSEAVSLADKQFGEISKIRHDCRNYLINALSLLEQERYEKAEDYLDKVVAFEEDEVVLDNKVIASVINMKLVNLKKNNVNFTYHICNDFAGYDSTELAMLIIALLNAVNEAALLASGGNVIFDIRRNEQYLTVSATCDFLIYKKNLGSGFPDYLIDKYEGTSSVPRDVPVNNINFVLKARNSQT